MTIEFDDLIPQNTDIRFDDLIPQASPVQPRTRRAVPERTISTVARDLAAGALQIGPTAIKGVADIGRLATGDRLGAGLSGRMERGMQAIREVVGSERAEAMRENFMADMADDEVGVLQAIGQNPGAIGNMVLPTIGSMFLPVGAGVAGARLATAGKAVHGMSKAEIAARVARAQTVAGVGTITAQNAASTFAELVDQGVPMEDAYLGAAITVPFTVVAGALTRGGAEGAVTRAITGTGSRSAAGRVGQVGAAGLMEGGQEAIETVGQVTGRAAGSGDAPSGTAAAKEVAVAGLLGALMGGGVNVATQAAQRGQPEQPTINLTDYQEAARQALGQTTPSQAPAQPVAALDADATNRILQAIERAQNVQNTTPAARTQAPAQAAPVEAPAPAGSDATPAAVLPDAGGSGDVQAAGLTFDDLVPATTEAPQATTEAAPVTPDAPVDGAITDEGTKPDVSLTNEGKTPILQNRNRATPSSIAQMQSIATQPDYGRLGFSRDFANGAPVVAGGQIAPEQLGRQDVAVASDGRRIPVQYAVVEAADVLPSNQADGTPNPDYGNQSVQRIRAIAGNGRIAGLQLAYRKGTTPSYLQELANDTLHGVSPDVIRAMRAPVLVRVMPTDQVTADIGDVSNTVGNLNLSAVEQANNDSQRVNLDMLQFAEDGSITPEAVRQFVRAMPQAEQGGLIDTNGQPTKQAVDRINAAVFARAYGNDQLVRLYAQAQDPEARNVLSALAQVAPKMARLEGAGALDIRDVVTQAAEIAVNARREGRALALAAQQVDMAADPMVGVVLELFASNARSVKPVVNALGNAADFAYTEATKPAADMFGEVPRASRDDVINLLRPQNERASQENLEQPAGRGPVPVDAGRAAAEPAAATNPAATQAGRPAEAEGLTEPLLTSPTQADIEQRQERLEQAQREQERADREAAETEDGITIKQGKGLIKGKFLADVDGDGVPGGPWDTEAKAREAAEAWKKTMADRATESATERARRDRIAEKFRKGEEVSNAEIESLGLKAGTSDMRWFMSTAANLFGLNSRDIRPIVKDLIRESLTDMGAKREFVPTRQALQAIAQTQAAPALTYTPASQIDSPTQGVLANAKERKARAFARLKSVRQQVKDGTANRLELLKAESAHKDAVREVEAAEAQLERDANRLGLTTVREGEGEYNAEAPRRPYTDDRQLQLFLDNGPDRSQAGPRGEAAQREAVAAVDDLRSTETILGLALSRDYAARQRVSLVGQKVSSAEDLAILAQVYRDPRFETFRVVFVNDAGKVVSQVGLTSRLPAAAPGIMGSDVNAYLFELSATARNRGATGFYMLHNHPSGLATPSVADRSLTQTFALTMPSLEFKSHVVIDTNEYSTIDAKGRSETLKKDFGQPAPYRAQEWADVQISGPSDVMAMAKRLQVDEGAITLIHTDSQYNVKAISTIPNDASTMSKEELKKLVLRASLQKQGAQVFAVGRDSKALARIGTIVVDAIYVEDSGQTQSLRSMGVIGGGSPLPEIRRTRVSPDTSPEFAYLRRQAQPAPMQRVAEPGMDQTQTTEFRRWFGSSQVVDAQGRPLVVYHGTAGERTVFEPYWKQLERDAMPYELKGNGSIAQMYQLAKEEPEMHFFAAERGTAESYGPDVVEAYLKIDNMVGDPSMDRDEAIQLMLDQDADGAIFRDTTSSGGYGGVAYVVRRSNQIKSAIGNQGTFDPNNPSIVREEGAEYSPEPPQNPNRDALGRFKFRLGEVALGKLEAAAGPALDFFSMRMASPELRKQLRQMKATIDKAKRAAVDVAQEMSALSEADRIMVSDIVEKMLAPGVIPPEHVVRVADAITRSMDAQTDELVELGMLSKDGAERWRGRYLPRIYNRQTELENDPLVQRLFKTGVPTMAGIGGGSLKGRGMFQDVSVDAVDQWIALGYEVRDPHWLLNQGKLELKDPNAPKAAREQVTVWRDWTPSERAQMGEMRDAMYRYVVGYTSMQRDIAVGRLFHNMANNPEWVRRSGAEGWLQVPSTEIADTGGVKRYGSLAGLWVRSEVMTHLTQFEEGANDTLQLYREAMGIWKQGKTAMNPVAHFNNIVSNLSMAHFAGVSYWDGHKYVNATRDLIQNAPMVDEARDVGLFTGSFTREEMMQNLPPELQKMANMQESQARKGGRLVLNAMTFWLRKPLTDAYEAEDTFFKYLIYRDARQQGMEPAEAMDYALRYIFAYDDLPSGARKVRDFAIPFFSYTYKAVPALLHTAMVYPWRLAAPAALLHGINAVAYALAAGDEDDDWLEKLVKGRELEAEEREAMPDHTRGLSALGSPKTIRLGTDEITGLPVFLDASRIIPGGDIFDMRNQAGGMELPAPLTPNHPILSTFAAMLVNREMFLGRNVTDDNDTAAEKAEKRAKWLALLLLPAISPGGMHSQRLMNATANAMDTVITTPLGEFTGVDRSGLPVQPKYAAMQTFGIKARPVDLELEAQRRGAQEQALVNSIAAEVRSMARLHQRGAVTDRMMEETSEKAREKIERTRE